MLARFVSSANIVKEAKTGTDPETQDLNPSLNSPSAHDAALTLQSAAGYSIAIPVGASRLGAVVRHGQQRRRSVLNAVWHNDVAQPDAHLQRSRRCHDVAELRSCSVTQRFPGAS